MATVFVQGARDQLRQENNIKSVEDLDVSPDLHSGSVGSREHVSRPWAMRSNPVDRELLVLSPLAA
jgi:hypothetical protein